MSDAIHGLWFRHVFQCYVRLHDKPLVSSNENAVTDTSKLSPKDLKNLHGKDRRKEKKYQENKKGTNSSTVTVIKCSCLEQVDVIKVTVIVKPFFTPHFIR